MVRTEGETTALFKGGKKLYLNVWTPWWPIQSEKNIYDQPQGQHFILRNVQHNGTKQAHEMDPSHGV